MKWFKHISTSLDDPDIWESINEFGGDGYLVFFGVLEVMAREFDTSNPGTVTIPTMFLTKKLQVSRQKVVKILKFFEKKGRVFHEINGGQITLKCPKLKEMADTFTARELRSRFEVTSVTEQEQETEQDKRTNCTNHAKNGHYAENIEAAYLMRIDCACKNLVGRDKRFNPFALVQKNMKAHPLALCVALETTGKQWEKGFKKSPVAFFNYVLKVESQNFNERDYVQGHEQLKNEMADPRIMALVDIKGF